MAEEARLAEQARIEAELAAGEAEKQAYWDAQEEPASEEKVVPDLPTQAVPLEAETPPSPLSKMLLIGGLLTGLGAAAYFFVL